ncbi:MAG: methyltransferase domain-containing protein [Chloroflexi bacterium]|nr:methyltransferase domain-containing protein [Ktedonobacteraceae bacterium]MBV9706834.1 methyltransferase domain-containing protein [Chloroflexota bacterium]
MANQFNSPENTSTYVINPEDAKECARSLLQDRLVTKEMGGVFPAAFEPSPGQMVLDLACGSGGWVLDVARTYPTTDVIGVDISEKMIRYAQAQAGILHLLNASFQVMDILKPLQFPENAFQFVNARFLSSFMPKGAWLHLLQECLRVTQPGGVIRLTDCEAPFSTSSTHEQIFALMKYAGQLDGKSFGPEGGMHGITLLLIQFLRDIGLTNIQRHAYALDYSHGTEAHEPNYQNFMMTFSLMAPWFVKMGVITKEEFERLHNQASVEMQQPDFHGTLFFLSAWGTKPANS